MGTGLSARARKLRQQQQAAFEVSLSLVAAACDPNTLAATILTLDQAELQLACATLAAMVDDEHLTLAELRRRALATTSEWCHPALWGESWLSVAEHGTRSRYAAGCRGAACVQADVDYHAQRWTDRRTGERRRDEPALQAVAD